MARLSRPEQGFSLVPGARNGPRDGVPTGLGNATPRRGPAGNSRRAIELLHCLPDAAPRLPLAWRARSRTDQLERVGDPSIEGRRQPLAATERAREGPGDGRADPTAGRRARAGTDGASFVPATVIGLPRR